MAWVRIFLLFWLKINKNLALRLTIRFNIGHYKKFLKNISQNAWKVFISLRIFILPNILGILYRLIFFSFLLKNLGNQQILCSEIFMRVFSKMPEKISGNFGNFSLLGKVINADFLSFLPKICWALWKIWMLEIYWHFGNSHFAQ